MPKQRIIIVQDFQNKQVMFAFTSLKKVCDSFEDFSYHYIRSLKFPFFYKGYEFQRVECNPGKIIRVGPMSEQTIDKIQKDFNENQ